MQSLLLHCHSYDAYRRDLLGSVSSTLQPYGFPNLSNAPLLKMILYGDERLSVDSNCCEAAIYSCVEASLGAIDSRPVCLFSTILQSDFGQRLLKWHRHGWNSPLLATKEHLRHISVLLLLIDSKPIYRFVMHHNSMSVNCRTREWTCATNAMRSTH